MTDIRKTIDGDTIQTEDGDRVRIANINTPESVHPDSSRNTAEGKEASTFAKNVLPEGSSVVLHDYGSDHFGRKVAGVSKNINGKDIDYGLVALDQEFSTYYVKKGTHADPQLHDQYKAYYSKYVPYQLGTAANKMSDADMQEMTRLQEEFTKAYSNLKEGTGTQEEFDTATANLYGDPAKVVQYRNNLKNWNKPVEQEDPNTIRGGMRTWIEQSPEHRARYNQAVRNAGLEFSLTPEKQPSFWENMKSSFRMYNDIANVMDVSELADVRKHGKDIEVPQGELYKGVPEQYHTMIDQEAAKYSNMSALTLRDQLVQDVADNKVFDNMEWYAQIGYGAVGLLASPTSLVAGGAAAKAGMAANAATKAWTASRTIQNASKLGTWAAAGAVESTVANAPRLASDHTYTARDYQMDIVTDAAFGMALGGVVHTGIAGYGKIKSKIAKANEVKSEARESMMQTAKDLETKAVKEVNAKEDTTPVIMRNEPAIAEPKTKADIKTNEVVAKAEAQAVTQERVVNMTRQRIKDYTPWEAIDVISPQGFKYASDTLRNTHLPDTPIRKLMNSQLGLNKKNLTPEQREVANKLNSDILHLASAFPDGHIPKSMAKSIEAVTFRQKTFHKRNALQYVLEGTVSNPTKTLGKYVDQLKKNDKLWQGESVEPMDVDSFMREQSDWMSRESYLNKEDTANMDAVIPKEISFLKDAVELNKMAIEKGDPAFTQAVEELNGMVAKRIAQREEGELLRFNDNKSFGSSVKMSPDEMFAQLKKEGLQKGTPEYKARFKQLRKIGRSAVSEDVNQVGRVDQYDVGEVKMNRFDERGAEFTDSEAVRGYKEMDIDQDLLPRSYTDIESISAYKDPTVENLTTLRDRLRKDILKKLGVLEIKGKKESIQQKGRLAYVQQQMIWDKKQYLADVRSKGDWGALEDLIRVQDSLMQVEKQRKSTIAKETVQEPTDANMERAKQDIDEDGVLHIDFKEHDIDTMLDDNTGKTAPKLPAEELKAKEDAIAKAYAKKVEMSAKRTADGLTNFVGTGEQKNFQEALKRNNKLWGFIPTEATAKGLVKMTGTKDIATKMLESKNVATQFIGARVTELGSGLGGRMRRKATGGIIRDEELKKSLSKFLPQYTILVDEYAAKEGKNFISRFKATQDSGVTNPLVEKINKDVMSIIEFRKQGKDIPANMNPAAVKMADQFAKYMDYNHGRLVDANVAGFTAQKKKQNYVPHVWKPQNLEAAIGKIGEDGVLRLFTKGYESAARNGNNPIQPEQALELAKRQIEWIKTKATQPDTDQFAPAMDSRAQARLEINTLAEVEGVSIMDLLNTDLAEVSTKYSNRMAGWVGLSRSTDGMISSELDIKAFRANLVQEGIDKGIDTTKDAQMYDDVMDLMLGKPARGGLAQDLRILKDATSLTRMGLLGFAQAIETGGVLTRGIMQTMKDPKTFKRMTGVDKNDPLLKEMQAMTGITDDLEFLQRQSVFMDQSSKADVSKIRALSASIADKATFGSLKAPAGRLLGKTTGFNLVRKWQSRVNQLSFALDVSKHFKDGTGRMGNARMADLGLTDIDGKDDGLQKIFNTVVEYGDDGLVKRMNFDKWDKESLEKFTAAMTRDDGQNIQTTKVGESPAWINAPAMSLVMQFKQMAITAMNKQLTRNMAFADSTMVLTLGLNAMFAQAVRSGLSNTKDTYREEIEGGHQDSSRYENPENYISMFGIFPDIGHIASDLYTAGTNGDTPMDTLSSTANVLMRQMPALGLMGDYIESGFGDDQVDSVQGLMPLGNTLYLDMLFTVINEQLNTEK